MSKLGATLVFIVEAFGRESGRLTFNIQRGDVSKRVGPFVNAKTARLLKDMLPIDDRVLLEHLMKNGFISGQCIDSRFKLFPDVTSYISSHKNLFVRTQRYGSIRKASLAERAVLSPPIIKNSVALPGNLLKGEIEIVDDSTLRLAWRYAQLRDSVPFFKLPNETEVLKTEEGGLVERDVKKESEWLHNLSKCLSLPFSMVSEGDFTGADISRLLLLPKDNWHITYKGKEAVLRQAQFGTSGISWFDEDGLPNELQTVNYDKIIEAYLAGRHHLEMDGKLVFLPSSGEEITDEIALRITTAGEAEIPFSSIAGVKKTFVSSEKKNYRKN